MMHPTVVDPNGGAVLVPVDLKSSPLFPPFKSLSFLCHSPILSMRHLLRSIYC